MSAQFKRTPRFALPSSSKPAFSSSAPFPRHIAPAEDIEEDDAASCTDPTNDHEPGALLSSGGNLEDILTSAPISNIVIGKARRKDDDRIHRHHMHKVVRRDGVHEDIESSPAYDEMPMETDEVPSEETTYREMQSLTDQESAYRRMNDSTDDDLEDIFAIFTEIPRREKRRRQEDDSPSLPRRARYEQQQTTDQERQHAEFNDLTANASSPIASPLTSPVEPTRRATKTPGHTAPLSSSQFPLSGRRHFLHRTPGTSDTQDQQERTGIMTLPPDFSPHRQKRSGRGEQRFVPNGLAAKVRDWIIQSSSSPSLGSAFPASRRLFAQSNHANAADYTHQVRVTRTKRLSASSQPAMSPPVAFPSGHSAADNLRCLADACTPEVTLLRGHVLSSAPSSAGSPSPRHSESHLALPIDGKAQQQTNVLLLGRGTTLSSTASRDRQSLPRARAPDIEQGDTIGIKHPTWTVALPRRTLPEERCQMAERADDEEQGQIQEWRVAVNWCLF